MRAAYDGKAFITPPIRGWILVAKSFLPTPGDRNTGDEATPFLTKLAEKFPEVQYFATQRVVSYAAWARLVQGKFTRKFAYSGEQGVVAWNSGTDFEAERQVGLKLNGPDDSWEKFPDENEVMAVARKWSIDPSSLESLNLPKSSGLVGTWN